MIYILNLGLINLLSSEMKNKDIDQSLFELCSTRKCQYDNYLYTSYIPRYLDLYSTPLNEFKVTSIDVLKNLRKIHKLEKTIFVTMTDAS